jgi:hypothetical protein
MFVAEIAERLERLEFSPLFFIRTKSGENSPHSTSRLWLQLIFKYH